MKQYFIENLSKVPFDYDNKRNSQRAKIYLNMNFI